MPWHYKTAKSICEALAETFLPKEKPYGIRASQYVKNGQYYKSKGLGRLALTEKSVAKWAFEGPNEDKDPVERKFGSFELWSPHWDKCAEIGNPPDIFWSFSNRSMPSDRVQKKISGFMVLAFASDTYDSKKTDIFVKNDILKQFTKPQAFTLLRKWAYSSGSSFHLSIQDFPYNGVFKDLVQAFVELVDKGQFQEAWVPL